MSLSLVSSDDSDGLRASRNKLIAPAEPSWLNFDASDANAMEHLGSRGSEVLKQVGITQSVFDIYGQFPAESCQRLRSAMVEISSVPVAPEVATAIKHLDTGLIAQGCR